MEVLMVECTCCRSFASSDSGRCGWIAVGLVRCSICVKVAEEDPIYRTDDEVGSDDVNDVKDKYCAK